MEHIQLDKTVGAIVTEEPQLSRVFEDLGIDYCCGGKVTLGEACRRNELNPHEVLTRLEDARGQAASGFAPADAAAMSLTVICIWSIIGSIEISGLIVPIQESKVLVHKCSFIREKGVRVFLTTSQQKSDRQIHWRAIRFLTL